VNKGELVAVVGPIGSGKTSLIRALLGEMRLEGGNVSITNGRVAYVPQTSWIPNDSLKNNVLFGEEYDEERWV